MFKVAEIMLVPCLMNVKISRLGIGVYCNYILSQTVTEGFTVHTILTTVRFCQITLHTRKRIVHRVGKINGCSNLDKSGYILSKKHVYIITITMKIFTFIFEFVLLTSSSLVVLLVLVVVAALADV